MFGSLTTIQLRELLLDSQVHRPVEGAVIFEQGDFTESFYSVLEGSVAVKIPRSQLDLALEPESGDQVFRTVSIPAGEFFGEMNLISGRRRMATVTAGEGCVLIETPRSSMINLVTSRADVRRIIDGVFVARCIANLVPGISPGSRAELAESAEFLTFGEGEPLWHEGDAFDGVYLIRRGSVTVSRQHLAGDYVRRYIPAGSFIGQSGAVQSAWQRRPSADLSRGDRQNN